jgi:hypothetical protein
MALLSVDVSWFGADGIKSRVRAQLQPDRRLLDLERWIMWGRTPLTDHLQAQLPENLCTWFMARDTAANVQVIVEPMLWAENAKETSGGLLPDFEDYMYWALSKGKESSQKLPNQAREGRGCCRRLPIHVAQVSGSFSTQRLKTGCHGCHHTRVHLSDRGQTSRHPERPGCRTTCYCGASTYVRAETPNDVPWLRQCWETLRKPTAEKMFDISKDNITMFSLPDGPEQDARDEHLRTNGPFGKATDLDTVEMDADAPHMSPQFSKWMLAYDVVAEVRYAGLLRTGIRS